MFENPASSRNWTEFRRDLLRVSDEGDHGWLDDQDVKAILNESSRTGLRPGLLISCRAAVGERKTTPGAVKSAVKTRILIIDDEPANCVVLKNALEKSGFEVWAEEKSENYRRVIEDFQPDLLLLDMVMPLVDGLDILEALGEDDATRDLPIIVLTGLLAESGAASVNREGLLFLAKPLGPRTLIHCINQHLETR